MESQRLPILKPRELIAVLERSGQDISRGLLRKILKDIGMGPAELAALLAKT